MSLKKKNTHYNLTSFQPSRPLEIDDAGAWLVNGVPGYNTEKKK